MPNLYSLTTFSGIVVCLATIALFYRYYTLGAVLLIMDGAGGTAIFWDRWSSRAGSQVHVDALFSPVSPTGSELAMLVTHLPLAIIGLSILAYMAWRNARDGRRVDASSEAVAVSSERVSGRNGHHRSEEDGGVPAGGQHTGIDTA